MRNWISGSLLALAVSVVLVAPAHAAIIYVDLGNTAPPATLGGQDMTGFEDARPALTTVAWVESPLGGTVGFSYDLELRRVPTSWINWGHAYTGEVYWTQGSWSPLTLTLPSGTTAFYLYVDNDKFMNWPFEVCADGTCSGLTGIGSFDSKGFGFYATGGDTLSSIVITAPAGVDFVVGEFGISQDRTVPEPASLLLMGAGLVGWVARRRLA